MLFCGLCSSIAGTSVPVSRKDSKGHTCVITSLLTAWLVHRDGIRGMLLLMTCVAPFDLHAKAALTEPQL